MLVEQQPGCSQKQQDQQQSALAITSSVPTYLRIIEAANRAVVVSINNGEGYVRYRGTLGCAFTCAGRRRLDQSGTPQKVDMQK